MLIGAVRLHVAVVSKVFLNGVVYAARCSPPPCGGRFKDAKP